MPVMSNWLRMTTIIGASAMIGTVCEATIQGISDRSSQRIETITTARPMPSAAPIDEADQRLLERDQAVIDEAALRGRRGREHEPAELGDDLMRPRQFRPLHVERIDDEILGRIVGAAGVGVDVALQRRVHQRRGDVPDRDDGEEDGRDGESGFHRAGSLALLPPSRAKVVDDRAAMQGSAS